MGSSCNILQVCKTQFLAKLGFFFPPMYRTSLSGVIFKSWGYKYGRSSESEIWEVTGGALYNSCDWF